MPSCPNCGKETINISTKISILGREESLTCSCGYVSIKYVANSKSWITKAKRGKIINV